MQLSNTLWNENKYYKELKYVVEGKSLGMCKNVIHCLNFHK